MSSIQRSTETVQTVSGVLELSQIEDCTGKGASLERFAA
jgi:hypothetical protein